MTTASPPQSSPHPFRWAVVWLGLVTLTFAGLTDNVVDHDGLTRLDRPWHQWVLAHRSAGLTHVMTAISTVGGTAVLAILAVMVAGWLLLRRRWAESLLVGVTTAGAGLLVPLVKNLIDRPRPPVADRLMVETSWSYPSGHSLGATAVLGVLTILLVRRLTGHAAQVAAGAAGVLLVVAIGLSRVYLGVHWPSDVLAGWLLGGLWLGCAVLSLRLPRLPAALAVVAGFVFAQQPSNTSASAGGAMSDTGSGADNSTNTGTDNATSGGSGNGPSITVPNPGYRWP